MRFVDLFAGLGGFHVALAKLGHKCVFASELDPELRSLYEENFPRSRDAIFGDIRESKKHVPPHDVLCAGFPCQPFSKSGYQRGIDDATRGTLFHEIIDVLRKHRPTFVILENVGNFERHNKGRTWTVVRESLEQLGYQVKGTTHIASGGPGLLSPHHLGFPHHRERFFIVGSRNTLPRDTFPPRTSDMRTSLRDILQRSDTFSETDGRETRLSTQQIECIDHWNRFLNRVPSRLALPSFPIWGDEIDASYPFEGETPFSVGPHRLIHHIPRNGKPLTYNLRELLQYLPSYARKETDRFPLWKERFIRQNRNWFNEIAPYIDNAWKTKLKEFPPSLRKLEWNCKGEERDLWRCVLQFRPSGLRAKRMSSVPALVAMTTTQIPIIGPKRRFVTRLEGLRLQGFPDEHALPKSRMQAFAALGNAVHVGVVEAVASRLLTAP